MVIEIDKQSLLPIIGVNESGKTSILQAIFTFDEINDGFNDGRHLTDVEDLYSTSPLPPMVSADLLIPHYRLKLVLENLGVTTRTITTWLNRLSTNPLELRVTRDLLKKQYSVSGVTLPKAVDEHEFAMRIVKRAPYILYFDDFRDTFDESIPIIKNARDQLAPALAIMEQLFLLTDPTYSVFTLVDIEERRRQTVISDVNRKLNDAVSKNWRALRLDDNQDHLRIKLTYQESAEAGSSGFLRLQVQETDDRGREHFFYIKDRSKGFYWFFNFVMKLEFNPKVVSSEDPTAVYLLDEPGSYLHSSAQRRLCEKLSKLAESNTVIYCTHSHYLLNPVHVPFAAIQVADRDGATNAVRMRPMVDYPGDWSRRGAFQPALDALQIGSSELDPLGRVLVVEGMNDFFAFSLLKQDDGLTVWPAVGADSVRFQVSQFLALGTQFKALWDNDDEGRGKHAEAIKHFGDAVAERHFCLLPGVSKKTILQDLFDGSDLTMLRTELALPANAKFGRVMSTWFYSTNKDALIVKVTAKNEQQVCKSV